MCLALEKDSVLYLSLPATPCGRCYCYPHLKDKETETKRTEVKSQLTEPENNRNGT